MPPSPRIDDLLGHEVVIDLRSRYVVAGRLVGRSDDGVELTDADVHDLHDTTTSREVYVVQLREFGIRPNRARVLVRLEEVVAISALADVLL
jgi:small nuclear ribonucleoprotein (snRNP)-like protein